MDQEIESENSENRRNDGYEEEVVKAKTYVVPNSKTKLRACDRCRLIKTQDQWRNSKGCENCGDFKHDDEYKTHTTLKFENMVTIIDPVRSWLRRKLFLGKKIVSGVYAVSTNS